MSSSKKEKRIRILHVVDGYRMGGAENKLLELIARLDRDKYEILLCNVGPDGPLKPQFEHLDIQTFDFPRRWSFDPIPVFKLAKLMRKHKIDVVQTTLFWADFIGAMAAKWAGVPLILSWETVSHEGDPYHNKFQRRKGYELASKLMNRIIAVSNEVKTSLVKRRGVPSEKISVIHYGVDLARYNPNGRETRIAKRAELGLNPDDFLIGIVARLEPWKGHDIFVEAFAGPAEAFSNVHVILVGDGSLRQSLEEQVRQHGLDSRIHFLGVRHDIAELLNCIDLFVLPSRPGEGLPNVLLEAMACGVPVVATNVGGVPELVRDGYNGYVVKTGDVAELRDALRKVISDKRHLKQLSENALTTVQTEFSLEKQLTAFEAVYDSVVTT